jgi:hypothetical protein
MHDRSNTAIKEGTRLAALFDCCKKLTINALQIVGGREEIG